MKTTARTYYTNRNNWQNQAVALFPAAKVYTVGYITYVDIGTWTWACWNDVTQKGWIEL